MSWALTKLSEVAEIERHGILPNDIQDGAAYLGLEHIASGGRIIGSQMVQKGELSSTKFRFDDNHVLYGKLRPYLGKIALPDFKGICSTDILPIRPGPKLDRKFLAYYLRQSSMVDYASSRSTGANLPRLSPKSLAEFDVPLPPLDEQKRIAAILDQADKLRRLRQCAIDKLNTLGQSIFYEMFGDPTKNDMGWKVGPLEEFGPINRGKSKHRPRNDPILLGGKYPLIQTGDVAKASTYITEYTATYSEIGLRQSKLWSKGTLCITIAANIADTAILGIDACFPDSVVGLEPHSDDTALFLHNWFRIVKHSISDVAPAVAQKNINLAILRGLKVISPPPHLIAEFDKRIRRLESHHAVNARTSELGKELFSSLQQRAFRGEL